MVNKVFLIGHLGNDPKTYNSESGTTRTIFNVATNERWTGKDGQQHEATQWHRIVTWNRLAENCHKFLAKGRKVMVEGKLTSRQFQNEQNQTQYITEIVAHTVQFLDRGQQDTPSHDSHDAYPPAPAPMPPRQPPPRVNLPPQYQQQSFATPGPAYGQPAPPANGNHYSSAPADVDDDIPF